LSDSSNQKDTLYSDAKVEEDFQFTPKVAEVFDDMLDRSVPCYRQTIEMTVQLLGTFLKEGDRVFDLGCSTGNTLLAMARKLDSMVLEFVGIDNSPAMIAKASIKAEMYAQQQRISFQEDDILEANLTGAGAVVLNYTLQFIRPMQRLDFLTKICQALRPGGVLIISEKILSVDPLLNRAYIDFYLDFKRQQGYSEIEIAKKREALENVLVPFTREENLELLERAGFSRVESFFQWFNFVSLIAIK